jgi:hypothetical protein
MEDIRSRCIVPVPAQFSATTGIIIMINKGGKIKGQDFKEGGSLSGFLHLIQESHVYLKLPSKSYLLRIRILLSR